MQKFRKLTPHDLTFGIGRKATKAELEELFSRPEGIGKEASEVAEDIKRQLSARRVQNTSKGS